MSTDLAPTEPVRVCHARKSPEVLDDGDGRIVVIQKACVEGGAPETLQMHLTSQQARQLLHDLAHVLDVVCVVREAA